MWCACVYRWRCRADPKDLLGGSGCSAARRYVDRLKASQMSDAWRQGKIVSEETCAIRQDAFSKVHQKFVTAQRLCDALCEGPFSCVETMRNYLYFYEACN
ncbi:hypothetical protein Hsero_1590 [Herbaspirillum seropedicae SmR1]|uniref:Uncharacterized protein n=1 Tax=Herbaspirillum seropedicae (strain SmR1) TaxID=757424 RepID=D8IQ57_HERSS|nr:hypothetical protein Hsero_1590 [Herbaspirillum seropedicae SmR1]